MSPNSRTTSSFFPSFPSSFPSSNPFALDSGLGLGRGAFIPGVSSSFFSILTSGIIDLTLSTNPLVASFAWSTKLLVASFVLSINDDNPSSNWSFNDFSLSDDCDIILYL